MARSCSGWSTANHFRRTDTTITNEPITLAAWYNASALTATMRVISLSDTDDANNSGRFGLVISGTAANDPILAQKVIDSGATTGAASVNTDSVTGEWRFAAAVFTSDTLRDAYFGNAGVVTTGTNATSVADPTVNVQSIGIRIHSSLTDGPMAGSIALPTIWTAALSLEEITALAKGTHPSRIRPKSIARGWWNPSAASRLVDFSGGQNTLTLVGTVTDDAFGPPVEPLSWMGGFPFGARFPEADVAAASTSKPYYLGGNAFNRGQRGIGWAA